jgi:hypothetical protein
VRSDEVEALAGERLGAEIQAVELLRATGGGAGGLDVWAVLTEHGTFWLVDGPAGAELLRAIGGGWDGVTRAVDRYRGLHPEAGGPALEPYACRACGVAVAPVRWSARTERGLCTRCLHADHMRRRYREDPAYRARELARWRAKQRGRAPARRS